MNTDLITFDQPKVELIKRMIAKDASNDELEMFLHQCRRTGLDPLAKQIYFQKRAGKPVIITGIDGYRLTADRTGLYAGNDDPTFDDEDVPTRATVTVYKMIKGQRCAFSATARWQQYYPGDQSGQMWRKMPHLMLGKCAEALALRKAFPAELSGLYVKEEMDQAERSEPLPEPPRIEAKNETPASKPTTAAIYNDKSPEHQDRLAERLKRDKIDASLWPDVGRKLHGRPFTDLRAATDAVLAEVSRRDDEFEIPFGEPPQ